MSLVVRVIAPTGRDAELISSVLQRNGVSSEAMTSTLSLGNPENDPIGPLLVAEEALSRSLRGRLQWLVQHQPAWSDLPILILTGKGHEAPPGGPTADTHFPLGAVLLERPIRTATLLSSVRAALRARRRQYEIRDAVARLKEEQETLQAVLDNLPSGVALAKPDGEIVLHNRCLQHMFPSVSSGGTWHAWPIYHPDGSLVAPEKRPLYRAMHTGQAVPPSDYLYDQESGTRSWISLAAAPIHNDSGTVTGAVVAVSGIDHQKRAEIALIQSEKLAAVGRLAASISHEINNPLEAITNLLYLARQSNDLSTEVRSYLNTAESELGRVSQIVSHTLRFHRQSTNARALSAKELLEPTLGLYAGRLHNSNVRLTVEHRGAGLVTCYEGEIRQVLNNLVGNALESMRSGGRLLVRTADSLVWKTGTPGVRITVADTGHGMTPEVARRVFDAFYTTKGINGTGLGLWISRGIVDKHQGLLQLHSSTRAGCSGTVFSLVLPCDPFPASTSL